MPNTTEQINRVQHWTTLGFRMHTAKQIYSQKWEEYERTFKMFTDSRTGEDEWRASLPDTWSYSTIKTAQAAFIDSRITPIITQHEDEDKIKAEDMRDLYQDVSDKGGLERELYFVRLDSFKLGIGFLKTTYVEDRRTIQQIKDFDPDTGKINFEEEKIKDFDDPKSVRISPWLMLIDEMARQGIDTARRCIELEIIGRDDAERIYGHLVDNFDDIPDASSGRDFLDGLDGVRVAQTADENTRSSKGDFGHIRSFTFFAPFELEPHHMVIWHCWDKIEDTYELIFNGYAVRVKADKELSPIPYIHKQLPYTDFPYSPYSGDEFWPAGIIELGRADAIAIKKNREMNVDRQRLSLFSPAFSDVDDEIDQRMLKLKPLSIIRTRGGVPTQFRIPGVTNADFAMEGRLEDSFKRVTGIDERVLGVSPQGPSITATEVEFLVEAALRRLKDYAFLYKMGIIREVKLKMSLFKQYYSSPVSRQESVKGDQGVETISKQFKVKTGNTYKRRSVSADLFNEEVDIDIEARALIPMSPARLVAKWGQVLRDITPFAEAGIVDIDLKKVVDKYIEALEVNPDSLKKDVDEQAILLAEGEHRLFVNENTSDEIAKTLKNGSPINFLNAAHIQRHKELMRLEDNIGEKELINLVRHIEKDTKNFALKLAKEQEKQAPQVSGAPTLGQIGGAGTAGGVGRLPTQPEPAPEAPLEQPTQEL